jgi:hypothetical protein
MKLAYRSIKARKDPGFSCRLDPSEEWKERRDSPTIERAEMSGEETNRET